MSRAIFVTASAADGQGFTGPCTLVGYTVRETGTAAGVLQLRDGTTISDPVKATIAVAISSSLGQILPSVDFTTGIFIDRTGTGVTELVLYVL